MKALFYRLLIVLLAFSLGNVMAGWEKRDGHGGGSADELFQTGVFSIRLPGAYGIKPEPEINVDRYVWRASSARMQLVMEYGLGTEASPLPNGGGVVDVSSPDKSHSQRTRMQATIRNPGRNHALVLTIRAESKNRGEIQGLLDRVSTIRWTGSADGLRLISADARKGVACFIQSSQACRCVPVGALVSSDLGWIKTIGDGVVEIVEWLYSGSDGEFEDKKTVLSVGGDPNEDAGP